MALRPSRSGLSATWRSLERCSCGSASVRRAFTTTRGQTSDKDPFAELAAAGAPPKQAGREGQQPPVRQSSLLPRWAATPERMKGPGFSINVVKKPSRTIWQCNDDPAVLDDMYTRFLGQNGAKMLPDELKWLAVTHKSFDQGRRGYNTKLAYFGRMVLTLEVTRAIVVSQTLKAPKIQDPHGREPFQHPSLANIDKLQVQDPHKVLDKEALAKVAIELRLQDVVRWKPRMPENLVGSGIEVVLNTALLAIVGAISLQHGAEVAQRVVRERLLKRLNL